MAEYPFLLEYEPLCNASKIEGAGGTKLGDHVEKQINALFNQPDDSIKRDPNQLLDKLRLLLNSTLFFKYVKDITSKNSVLCLDNVIRVCIDLIKFNPEQTSNKKPEEKEKAKREFDLCKVALDLIYLIAYFADMRAVKWETSVDRNHPKNIEVMNTSEKCFVFILNKYSDSLFTNMLKIINNIYAYKLNKATKMMSVIDTSTDEFYILDNISAIFNIAGRFQNTAPLLVNWIYKKDDFCNTLIKFIHMYSKLDKETGISMYYIQQPSMTMVSWRFAHLLHKIVDPSPPLQSKEELELHEYFESIKLESFYKNTRFFKLCHEYLIDIHSSFTYTQMMRQEISYMLCMLTVDLEFITDYLVDTLFKLCVAYFNSKFNSRFFDDATFCHMLAILSNLLMYIAFDNIPARPYLEYIIMLRNSIWLKIKNFDTIEMSDRYRDATIKCIAKLHEYFNIIHKKYNNGEYNNVQGGEEEDVAGQEEFNEDAASQEEDVAYQEEQYEHDEEDDYDPLAGHVGDIHRHLQMIGLGLSTPYDLKLPLAGNQELMQFADDLVVVTNSNMLDLNGMPMTYTHYG